MFVNYSKMSLVINNFLIHNKKRIIFSLNDKFVLVKDNTIYIYDLETPIKYNCDILAKKILRSKELPFNYKYKIYGLDRNKQATIFRDHRNRAGQTQRNPGGFAAIQHHQGDHHRNGEEDHQC